MVCSRHVGILSSISRYKPNAGSKLSNILYNKAPNYNPLKVYGKLINKNYSPQVNYSLRTETNYVPNSNSKPAVNTTSNNMYANLNTTISYISTFPVNVKAENQSYFQKEKTEKVKQTEDEHTHEHSHDWLEEAFEKNKVSEDQANLAKLIQDELEELDKTENKIEVIENV